MTKAFSAVRALPLVSTQRLWFPFFLLLSSAKLYNSSILLACMSESILQLRRHFETDTLPWIQRLHQKEQELQRRLLKVNVVYHT